MADYFFVYDAANRHTPVVQFIVSASLFNCIKIFFIGTYFVDLFSENSSIFICINWAVK
ncbi:hypothetical protein DVDV_2755 [Desulfovibrio sp. DV]|nr:hypothetical protein DVDV_2755 [Desulfovibrio sp. DV]